MPTFGVIENKTVTNVIVADSKNIAQELTGKECVEINETVDMGIGWYWLDNFEKYVPPAPYENWIYNGEKWIPPIEYPAVEEGSEELYFWDQNTTSWLLLPPSN